MKDRVIELSRLAAKNWWKAIVLIGAAAMIFCGVLFVVGKTGTTIQKGDMKIEGRK